MSSPGWNTPSSMSRSYSARVNRRVLVSYSTIASSYRRATTGVNVPERIRPYNRAMNTLEFHDPSGAIEIKQPFAPRISGLAGKRVGFVSNDQWQAFRMLPLLKSLLAAGFPGIEGLRLAGFAQGQRVMGSGATPAAV